MVMISTQNTKNAILFGILRTFVLHIKIRPWMIRLYATSRPAFRSFLTSGFSFPGGANIY